MSVSGCKDKETTVSIASWKVPGGLVDLVLSGGKTSRVTFHSPTDPVELRRIRRSSEGARKESRTKLTWTKTNEEIEVVFPDGLKDKIHLVGVKEHSCLFSGSLDNDQDSEVTIVGCQGEEEVLVEIASYREAGGILELILSSDGKTYDVPKEDVDMASDKMPEPEPDVIDTSLPQAAFSGSLPNSVTLKIRLKYDNTLLGQFSSDHTKVKRWLSTIVELAKPKLSTLNVKVHLEVVGSIEHYKADMEANNKWIYGLVGRGEIINGPI